MGYGQSKNNCNSKINGFNHSNIEEDLGDLQLIEMCISVEDWADLVHNAAVTYEDFVNVDANIEVCGDLTNENILKHVKRLKTDNDNQSSDEDEREEADQNIFIL